MALDRAVNAYSRGRFRGVCPLLFLPSQGAPPYFCRYRAPDWTWPPRHHCFSSYKLFALPLENSWIRPCIQMDHNSISLMLKIPGSSPVFRRTTTVYHWCWKFLDPPLYSDGPQQYITDVENSWILPCVQMDHNSITLMLEIPGSAPVFRWTTTVYHWCWKFLDLPLYSDGPQQYITDVENSWIRPCIHMDHNSISLMLKIPGSSPVFRRTTTVYHWCWKFLDPPLYSDGPQQYITDVKNSWIRPCIQMDHNSISLMLKIPGSSPVFRRTTTVYHWCWKFLDLPLYSDGPQQYITDVENSWILPCIQMDHNSISLMLKMPGSAPVFRWTTTVYHWCWKFLDPPLYSHGPQQYNTDVENAWILPCIQMDHNSISLMLKIPGSSPVFRWTTTVYHWCWKCLDPPLYSDGPQQYITDVENSWILPCIQMDHNSISLMLKIPGSAPVFRWTTAVYHWCWKFLDPPLYSDGPQQYNTDVENSWILPCVQMDHNSITLMLEIPGSAPVFRWTTTVYHWCWKFLDPPLYSDGPQQYITDVENSWIRPCIQMDHSSISLMLKIPGSSPVFRWTTTVYHCCWKFLDPPLYSDGPQQYITDVENSWILPCIQMDHNSISLMLKIPGSAPVFRWTTAVYHWCWKFLDPPLYSDGPQQYITDVKNSWIRPCIQMDHNSISLMLKIPGSSPVFRRTTTVYHWCWKFLDPPLYSDGPQQYITDVENAWILPCIQMDHNSISLMLKPTYWY